ncbi:MAG: hypothetical protein IJH36_00555, partial [Clostridia bacterium]|nr:hypothetical protein [Clostridia bacterium]
HKNKNDSKPKVSSHFPFGADGGGRTHTVLLPRDFEGIQTLIIWHYFLLIYTIYYSQTRIDKPYFDISLQAVTKPEIYPQRIYFGF